MTPRELLLARYRLDASQVALGHQLGLSREAISLMERGRRPIELRTELALRYRLLEAQVCTLEDFK